jgi:hypothetical protein
MGARWMIRAATYADIPALIAIGALYAPQISAHYDLDEPQIKKTLLFLMASKRGCVFVSEVCGEIVGLLIGQIDRLWFSKKFYATDIAFLVKPGHPMQGYLMAKRFVNWAKSFNDVIDVTMQISSGLGDTDRIGRMYERLGLKRVGGCFTWYR